MSLLEKFDEVKGEIDRLVESASWMYVDAQKLGEASSIACTEIADAIASIRLAKRKLEAARFRIGEILKQRSV